jgi:hypothetical protein
MCSPEQPLKIAELDKQVALEAPCSGQSVILFWCDRHLSAITDK